jgi:hypothetical protein
MEADDSLELYDARPIGGNLIDTLLFNGEPIAVAHRIKASNR